MKKIKNVFKILVVASFLILNLTNVNADTYAGSKSSGTRTEYLYYSKYTTKKVPMSGWFGFPVKGRLSTTISTQKSTNYSAEAKVGAKWIVASIEAKLKVDYSCSRKITVAASWEIPAGKKARVSTIYYRYKVRVKCSNMDNKELWTVYSYPAKTNSYIGAEIVSL